MKKQLHMMTAVLLAASLFYGCSNSPAAESESQPVSQETVASETMSTSVSESETESQTETETEAAPDYTNLVTDALNETVKVTVYDEISECSYRIPVINWDGDEIAALNDQIYEKYSAYYQHTNDNGERGWFECNECSYTWSVTDDILTLIMSASLYPDASGWTEPEVFSINLKDSTVMSKEDIRDYFGLTAGTYNQTVKDALGNQFCQIYGESFDNNSSFFYDSFTQDQLARTIAQDNINFTVPYINEDGNLGLRAKIYSLAGGDSYPHLIDTETLESSKWYMEFSGNTNDSGNTAAGNDVPADTDDPGEYIIADSNSRYLEASDIAGLSSDQIQMAVNEIYARHGRKFKDDGVRAYFESKSWYSGSVEPEQFDTSVFNQYEEANLEYLLEHK